MPKIHPTAAVDPRARIAEDVEIGPGCVVEGDVEIGTGTILRPHAVIRRYTSLGEGNFVDSGAVLGGDPQDLKFDPATVAYLRIGDGNTFREGVTISRASKKGQATVVGSKTYWMATSHAGHDARIDDGAILVNGALVAGHAHVGPRAFLSGHVVVHQFTWIGEGVMSQGHAGTSTHMPPFVLFAGINRVAGLNIVGLRRTPEVTPEDRRQIQEAFRLTYRAGFSAAEALARMDQCSDWGAPASRYREFIRRVVAAEKPYNRGLGRLRKGGSDD